MTMRGRSALSYGAASLPSWSCPMLRRLRSLSRRQRALLAAGVGATAAGVYYLASGLLDAWREEERTLALRALAQQREREAAEREAEQQCVRARRHCAL